MKYLMQNQFNPSFDLSSEYRREMLRRAEQERLIRMAREGQPSRATLQRAILTWTGRQMMKTGLYLLTLAEPTSKTRPAMQIRKA